MGANTVRGPVSVGAMIAAVSMVQITLVLSTKINYHSPLFRRSAKLEKLR